MAQAIFTNEFSTASPENVGLIKKSNILFRAQNVAKSSLIFPSTLTFAGFRRFGSP